MTLGTAYKFGRLEYRATLADNMAAFAGLSEEGKRAYLGKGRDQIFCFQCETAVSRRIFNLRHIHNTDREKETSQHPKDNATMHDKGQSTSHKTQPKPRPNPLEVSGNSRKRANDDAKHVSTH